MQPTITDTNLLRLFWEDPSTGDPIEQIYPLPITIGRGLENTITFNSNRISRLHAEISTEGGQIVIADKGSTNGTFVNQERIDKKVLADGDLVQIGPFAVSVDVHPFFDTPESQTMLLRWADPETNEAMELALTPPVSIGRAGTNDVSLTKGRVSRQHALIKQEGEQLVVVDRESTNGTFVNGQKVEQSVLRPGDTIKIGPYTLSVISQVSEYSTQAELDPAAFQTGSPDQATLAFDEEDALRAVAAIRSAQSDFPPSLFQAEQVSLDSLRQTGVPIDEIPYLAIGGGIGSFVWVDHLRVFGVPTDQITVIGLEDKPYGRYRRLCVNSQIPEHERLRSDSGSTPDNIWGWPGYGVREVWNDLKGGQIGNAVKVSWHLFGEPTLIQTYTPKSGQVFDSMDIEAERIGWDEMYRFGRVKAIRKTNDGRYAVAYTQTTDAGRQHRFVVANYAHVAVGYPGVRFLPDLQRYREETHDFTRVINAYEAHDEAYAYLEKNGGVVMVRGRGIVASRIIQRLYEARAKNPNIYLLLLLRSPLTDGNKYGYAKRAVENHWEFQPFNWPKACWGGELRNVLENASDPERDQLLNDWGGTTTADRTDWQQILRDGLREGWYQIKFGNVKKVELNDEGKLVTHISGRGAVAEESMLVADYIIDCTGLQASLDFNPLLKDLVEHHQLPRNPKGRLYVENDFEIRGMRNGEGRIYAAGAMTLGGPYAAVDSFLGLQYSALWSVDALAKAKAPHLRKLNGFRSLGQWMRWARGVAP